MGKLPKTYSGFYLLLALLLSACGGSSSSSGSGGTPAGERAGTYNGTQTITASRLLQTVTATTSITIIITDNGSVTIRDNDDGDTIKGTLSGNSFTVRYTSKTEIEGTTFCDQVATYNGTVNGTKISGTITGGICDEGDIIKITFNSGSFQATK